ncbi:MAG: F-type H+-transporting ATPase subunit b [Hyphomicrobiaceae bacterium]|jgi:F-type H+-transporting ATPase subunit b
MKRNSLIPVLLTSIVLGLGLITVPALASEAAHATEHQGPTGSDWFLLFCTIINFSIFAFLMVRFTKAPLTDYLNTRREDVVAAMSAAAKAKAEADQLKADYQAKAAALDETRTAMITEIKEIAAKDRERALAEAAEAAERMQRDAELRADNEVAAARRELRAEASRLAAELAEVQVRAELDVSGRKALLDDFLGGVSGT